MTERVNEAAEPVTEAGRALLDASDVLLMLSGNEIIGLNEGELELQIRAIEREATERATAAVDVERLARALEQIVDLYTDNRTRPASFAIQAGEIAIAALARLSGESE